MPPLAHQLVNKPVAPVSCHAWNADRTQLAISPNNNLVLIYQYNGGNFTLLHTLDEHTQRVTAIDWAPKSNCIVTCGQDRNAYVFRLEGNVWKPTLVILRINRAATCAKWSPSENKFAIGSGSRLVSVCYFDPENDWWVSKHIKKPIRSTVLTLDWHPNNILLAVGSSDFKCRIFSTYVKEVEEKPSPTTWGKKMPFNEVMGEFGTSKVSGGWIHAVAFSPSGDQLAFAAHDSSVTVIDSTQENKAYRATTSFLPFRALMWLTPRSFIAGGHDYVPVLFDYNGSALATKGSLDVPEKKATKALDARGMFAAMDSKGTADSASVNVKVDTVHQNAISEFSVFSGARGAVTKFVSVGVDGQLVIWDTKAQQTSSGESAT
jgi:actin related protein 2/3 complex subunit 1A/1B